MTVLAIGQDLYFHLNHPIKWVQVAGVVVAIDEFYGKRSYTIDDSSGATIECLVNIPKQNANLAAISETAAGGTLLQGRDKHGKGTKAASAESSTTLEEVKVVIDNDIDVGDILLVKGNVTVFRENKQIRVYRISHLRSTDEEVQFWQKLTDFYDVVLSKPWLLSDKELRRCRRAATRSGDADPREHKRSKRKPGHARVTGLEKATVTTPRPVKLVVEAKGSAKVRATGLEPGSMSKTIKRSETTSSAETHTKRPRVTGLERTTKRAESVACSPAHTSTPAKITSAIETVRPAKRRVTGLERGIIRQDEASNSQMTSSSSPAPEDLGPERRRARRARVTGLETGLMLIQRSFTNSADTSETEAVERRRRARLTGLERVPKRRMITQAGLD
jgi:hypothetical protein